MMIKFFHKSLIALRVVFQLFRIFHGLFETKKKRNRGGEGGKREKKGTGGNRLIKKKI